MNLPFTTSVEPWKNSQINWPKDENGKDLDVLIAKQEEDDRWDTCYGISEEMKLEWSWIQNLWTLKVLKNYDRIAV